MNSPATTIQIRRWAGRLTLALALSSGTGILPACFASIGMGVPAINNPEGIVSSSPGLARSAYPGSERDRIRQPHWGCIKRTDQLDATLSGLLDFRAETQGSSLARNPGLSDGIPLGFPRTASFEKRSIVAATIENARIATGEPNSQTNTTHRSAHRTFGPSSIFVLNDARLKPPPGAYRTYPDQIIVTVPTELDRQMIQKPNPTTHYQIRIVRPDLNLEPKQ